MNQPTDPAFSSVLEARGAAAQAAESGSANTPAQLIECAGFRADRFALFDLAPTALASGQVVARLVAQHRTEYELHGAARNFRAEAHPKLRQLETAARPAVGDFVLIKPGEQYFQQLLPRYSALKRASAGDKYAEQVLAANIDRAFIVCGLDRDFSPRRIERYLALVQSCGIAASVILTKADGRTDYRELLADLQHRLSQEDIHAVDARDPAQLEWLAQALPAHHTGVLLGSSGAGKSTLSNTLSNSARMQTGAVRASDGRGRHTTVHRALLQLPWGACLIDSPGLREIKLAATDDEVVASFDDIQELALQCKFRDCKHEREPGCAVQAAIQSGALLADRFVSYQKLQIEQAATQAKVKRYSNHKVLRR